MEPSVPFCVLFDDHGGHVKVFYVFLLLDRCSASSSYIYSCCYVALSLLQIIFLFLLNLSKCRLISWLFKTGSLSSPVQMSGWWFLTFTGFEIKERVEYLPGVEHLRDIVPIQQLQLPTFIMEYDKKVGREDGETFSEVWGEEEEDWKTLFI